MNWRKLFTPLFRELLDAHFAREHARLSPATPGQLVAIIEYPSPFAFARVRVTCGEHREWLDIGTPHLTNWWQDEPQLINYAHLSRGELSRALRALARVPVDPRAGIYDVHALGLFADWRERLALLDLAEVG